LNRDEVSGTLSLFYYFFVHKTCHWFVSYMKTVRKAGLRSAVFHKDGFDKNSYEKSYKKKRRMTAMIAYLELLDTPQEKTAFQTLYEMYAKKMYLAAVRIVDDSAAAEDYGA